MVLLLLTAVSLVCRIYFESVPRAKATAEVPRLAFRCQFNDYSDLYCILKKYYKTVSQWHDAAV